MRLKSRQQYISLYLLGVMSIFFCIAPHAYADNSSTTSEVSTEISGLKDVTVNIYCRIKAGNKVFSSSGSGVIINNEGVLLTNAHVAQFFLLPKDKGRVTSNCSIRTGSPAKKSYDASVLFFPPQWLPKNSIELTKTKPTGTGEEDFALLKIELSSKKILPKIIPPLVIDIENSLTAQPNITIAGYPTENLNYASVRNKLALVVASSTIIDTRGFKNSSSMDIITLAPSKAGSHGISGGPIFTNTGNIVGIVTTKSSAKGDRTLRGITLEYIDQSLNRLTGNSLDTLLANSNTLSPHSATSSPQAIKIITQGIIKKKQ